MALGHASATLVVIDEQTPLLRQEDESRLYNEDVDEEIASRSDYDSPLINELRSTLEEQELASLLERARQRHSKWRYAWRVLWLLIIAAIVSILIESCAGADNKEFDLEGAIKSAFRSGVTGAAATVFQVLLLMPLDTLMTYQHRHGHGFRSATKALYQEEGLCRYYQGLGAALIQAPLARFGDTAANDGVLALLQSNPDMSKVPTILKTVFASICAAGFRMIFTPIDTLKTTLQAQGSRGTVILRRRVKKNGFGSLWWGAVATAAATFVGHYPWFATYNGLSEVLNEPSKHRIFIWLLRLAFIGFCASLVSDTVSNSLRVVKTYRQVNDTQVSYSEAARRVVRQDGIGGLFGRGLKTRILCNGLQGVMFTILWKLFLDLWEQHTSD